LFLDRTALDACVQIRQEIFKKEERFKEKRKKSKDKFQVLRFKV